MEHQCIPSEYNYPDMYSDPSLKERHITYDVINKAVTNLKMSIGAGEVRLTSYFS